MRAREKVSVWRERERERECVCVCVCVVGERESSADLAEITEKLAFSPSSFTKRRKDKLFPQISSGRSRRLRWTTILPSWQDGLAKVPWVFCPRSVGYNLC